MLLNELSLRVVVSGMNLWIFTPNGVGTEKPSLRPRIPASTRRNNNVIITSKQRRFDVIITLLLRCVPAGMLIPISVSYHTSQNGP